MDNRQTKIAHHTDYFLGHFFAMASDCELLIETDSESQAATITQIAADETWRIEAKYSRYRKNNLCYAINNSKGAPVTIDSETYRILQFCDQAYQLSEGMFDVTSGLLSRVWQFDSGSQLPDATAIEDLLPYIGWSKIKFVHNRLEVPNGMSLDFGGIGKEYAVDKVTQIIKQAYPDISVVVNFGGDLSVTYPPLNREHWLIGVEQNQQPSTQVIAIKQGAIATSGDANRYLVKDGVRYSHILNPMTGWPAKNSPQLVTVAGKLCLQAGLLATLAMLYGTDAESFLKAQNVKYWCLWH